MHKLLLVVLLTTLISCSKKADNKPTDTTIEYRYTADVNESYLVTYIDENNNPVNENFTGASWSKKFTTNQAKGFKWAQFGMSTSSLPLHDTNGDAVILINGKNTNEQIVHLGRLDGDSFVFHVVVFK